MSSSSRFFVLLLVYDRFAATVTPAAGEAPEVPTAAPSDPLRCQMPTPSRMPDTLPTYPPSPLSSLLPCTTSPDGRRSDRPSRYFNGAAFFTRQAIPGMMHF